MCGISGIISLQSNHTTASRLQQMTDVLQHRGPDGEGLWIDEHQNVALGHRRLAVIDLSPAGAQPMHYADRYVIVHNGEIYNYPELKATLTKNGYRFQSQSDTEIIVAAYDFWKADCLQQLDGMFAFAIWDRKNKQLFAARDRFGEKPFYYFYDGEQFLFASEMKALWAAGIRKDWNHLMLLNYLANGHTQNAVDASLTFYNEIFSLPPGHYATYDLRRRELFVQLYWDLDKQTQKNITESEAIDQFQQLFETSVRRRLRSDVPIGTSLSGGLDSSAVVTTIQKILRTAKDEQAPSPAAFTATFPGFEKDEFRFAEQITGLYNLEHFTTSPTLEGFMNDFERLCYFQEQPFSSSSVYAQFKVMESARNNGRIVLLDGQGADELLAGYNKYIHWFLQEMIGKFKFGFAMQERILLQQNQYPFQWGFANYLAAFFPIVANAHLEEIERKHILLHPHINREYAHAHYDKFYSVHKPPVSKLNDILYFNTMQQGLGELLHYADRNSMAHGVEIRLPFLSHELAEFVFSMPSRFKIHNGYTKWLLRSSMKNQLPEKIVYRTDKIGYEPPQLEWMQHTVFQDRIQEGRKKLVHSGILNPEVLKQPVSAKSAYASENYDWRYLCAAQCL
ncbi:MAG: asparagine synthase (glutamine-hydrolyzing) [Lacibacter sp.]